MRNNEKEEATSEEERGWEGGGAGLGGEEGGEEAEVWVVWKDIGGKEGGSGELGIGDSWERRRKGKWSFYFLFMSQFLWLIIPIPKIVG